MAQQIRRGFSLCRTPYPSPSRSITPGRKFSTSTSARATSRFSASFPRGSLRFSVIDFLPAFCARKLIPIPLEESSGSAPRLRARSPRPTDSTLITSVPRCASWWQAKGPASTFVRSSTRTPESGAGDRRSVTIGHALGAPPRTPGAEARQQDEEQGHHEERQCHRPFPDEVEAAIELHRSREVVLQHRAEDEPDEERRERIIREAQHRRQHAQPYEHQ